jgi:hypothetical protein
MLVLLVIHLMMVSVVLKWDPEVLLVGEGGVIKYERF